MGTPYLGELRIFSFNFAPKGWAQCNGQLMAINQNQALFSILGTTSGGDGRVNLALPTLQGRVPFHTGEGLVLGQHAGEENHTLIISEMAAHNHFVNAFAGAGSVNPPTGNQFAEPIATIAANTDIPDQRLRVCRPRSRHGPAFGHQRRRQPATSQHVALPDAADLHLPAGHLPVAELSHHLRGRGFRLPLALPGADFSRSHFLRRTGAHFAAKCPS